MPQYPSARAEDLIALTYGESQSVEAATPGNSTARATAEALFRHLPLFLAVAGAVMLGAVLYTFLTPFTYESEMNILVRNARPDYLLSPEKSTGQLIQNEVTEERVGSEIDVLKSRDIADLVVDPAWTGRPAAERGPAETAAHEKAVADFEKHLFVEPLKKSNVIRAAYDTTDPRRATDTLNRLLDAFLAKQRDIERSTGASTFFAGEAARYKGDLDQAQQQLAAFQQTHQIVQIGPRETTLETQINQLEDAIRAAQVQGTEAANRVASDRRQIALQPARQATAQRSIPEMETIWQLTATLTNYQNKRTELLTRYKPSDKLVIEVEKQIQDTSAALANARALNGLESTTDVNPVYQQLKSNLSLSTADLAADQGRLADLIAQRNALKQQLSDVEGAAVEYTTLQSRVTELETNYQLYTQKKNEAGIADAMNQQQLVNVAIAERPTYSAKRVKPQIAVQLALGLFTAVFLGGCAVFFAELGRQTFSAPWELEAISRAPVLATVPFLDTFPRPRPVSPAPRPAPAPTTPNGATTDTSESPVGGTVHGQKLPSEIKANPVDGAQAPGPNRTRALAEAALPTPNPQEPGMTDSRPSQASRRPAPPRDATVMRRAAVMSYEQLVAARNFWQSGRRSQQPLVDGEPVPRDPLAHPIQPPRMAGAAQPIIRESSDPIPSARPGTAASHRPREAASTASLAPIEVIEPIEPTADLAHDPVRPAELHRSRLTPSQRAALGRRATTRDSQGRQTYVTYTVAPPDRR